MFTFIYRKPSDCIISSNHPNRPTVLFRPIIQIVRPYYFVRLYYFLRSSNLPFNVQFSSSYFALFLYLNTNLIQIKSRTRTFPETATRSLRPRRTYCNNVKKEIYVSFFFLHRLLEIIFIVYFISTTFIVYSYINFLKSYLLCIFF